MADVFVDNFVEDVDTDLDLHAPDVGDAWSKLWGTGPTIKHFVAAATDTVRQSGGANSGAIYSADTVYDSDDYVVEYSLAAIVGAPAQAIIVRMSDVENFWCLFHGGTGGTSTLVRKKVAGVWGSATGFQTPAVGDVIKIEIIGVDLIVYVNDVVKSEHLLIADIPASGVAGLGMGGGAEMFSSGHDPAGWGIEYFKVTTLGGGAIEELAGTSAGSSAPSGDLSRLRNIEGASAGVSTPAGDATRIRNLEGVAAGGSSPSGSAVRTRNLEGASAGVATCAGALSIDGGGPEDLAGLSQGSSSGAGVLTRERSLEGLAAGVASPSGSLSRLLSLEGSSSGGSSCSGELTRDRELAGTSAGSSSPAGTMTTAEQIVLALEIGRGRRSVTPGGARRTVARDPGARRGL